MKRYINAYMDKCLLNTLFIKYSYFYCLLFIGVLFLYNLIYLYVYCIIDSEISTICKNTSIIKTN